MNKDKPLSEKDVWIHSSRISKDESLGFIHRVFDEEDVAEAVKRLKEALDKLRTKENLKYEDFNIIDGIFGSFDDNENKEVKQNGTNKVNHTNRYN